MNEEIIIKLCIDCFAEQPKTLSRCAVGQGNYVYIVELSDRKVVVRCSEEKEAYKDTIYWLERLEMIDIPVPRVLGKGIHEGYTYVILTYFEGQDIGIVYTELTAEEKCEIAKAVVDIQNKVALLPLAGIQADWTWKVSFVDDMLARARERIVMNGYFDPEKVERLMKAAEELETYFAGIQPFAYLDDISTKNLLIYEGRVSGVIDIDWMGVGDQLTYVAMTHMALLNMGCDTDYVAYLLDAMHVTEEEKRAFAFYTLLYCVDFMGERGMWFMDKQVPVSEEIVEKMNGIYDMLWEEYRAEITKSQGRS
jgi:aminoglycoside phosphotransferase (APT) family kinase protein